MKKQNGTLVLAVIIMSIALLLTGCRGKSSEDAGQAQATSGDQPAFNVAGSKQLVALSNTITASSSSSGAKGFLAKMLGRKPLFQYRIVNQGLTPQDLQERAKSITNGTRAAATQQPSGTNLLALDADGNAQIAIASNYMVKVMYSVADPAGEYVYLALDPGLVADGNDYSQFIGSNNCALYKVKLADNSFSCLKEGVYVQNIDTTYSQTISNNLKPIQFDNVGNVYFAASTFSRNCDEQGKCAIFISRSSPRIYRAASTGNVIPLTQDNQSVRFYLVMSTGQIAYQSSTASGTSLYLWQPSGSPLSPNGTTINLTGPSGSSSYFAIDSYNTIMWQGLNGIKFARPISSSGVEKAALNTSIFSPTGSAAIPSKIIVGDDGKLYGIFQDSKSVQDPNTKQYSYYSIYRIFEVLPANVVPKFEIQVPQSSSASNIPFNAVSIFGSTPFQISHGFLFYKETKEKLGYGTYDIINMVNLSDGTVIPLLASANTWYEIYSWRLRGNKLYFSALDLARTIVISGEIDVALVQAQPQRPQTDYFSYRDFASALGASSRVQDIEGLTPLPTMSVAAAPQVSNIYTDIDNIYSASIEFNKLMDTKSVEENLTMADSSKAVVAMKVWINNFLHLIPDLDNNGTTQPDDALLDLKGSTPLNFDTVYTLTLGTGAKDLAGTAISAPVVQAFLTRPESGWYIYNKVAKYAGLPKDPVTKANKVNFEYYSMNAFKSTASTTANLPADFRFQFHARNKASGGIGIVVYDATSPSSIFSSNTFPYYYGESSHRFYISLNLQRSNGSMRYNSSDYGYAYPAYAYSDYNNVTWATVFNGDWQYYRFDLYQDKLALSMSKDGLSYTNLPFQVWNSSQGTYDSMNTLSGLYTRPTATHTYQLHIKTKIPVDFDDVLIAEITGVDGSGNPILGSTLVTENFDSRAKLMDAPALDGTVKNAPVLSQPTSTTPTDPYGILNQESN